jgi:Na+-driven multidrug efflux pump
LGTLRSVETVRIGFYVSLLSLVVNIALNYCLIYGRFGLPELGVEGAAIATLISRIVEFIVVVLYVGFVDRKLRLRLHHLLALSAAYARDFFRSGMPLVLSSTSWGIAMSIQTAIIGRLGEAAISASSIATTIFQVVTVVAYGIATASGVVIGETSCSSPVMYSTVLMSPALRPASVSMACSIWLTVVFPFVPVTPIVVILSAG